MFTCRELQGDQYSYISSASAWEWSSSTLSKLQQLCRLMSALQLEARVASKRLRIAISAIPTARAAQQVLVKLLSCHWGGLLSSKLDLNAILTDMSTCHGTINSI